MGLACTVGLVEAWELEVVGIWEVVAVLVVVVGALVAASSEVDPEMYQLGLPR